MRSGYLLSLFCRDPDEDRQCGCEDEPKEYVQQEAGWQTLTRRRDIEVARAYGEVRLVFLPSGPSPGKHWPVFSTYRLPPHNRFKSATLLSLSNVREAKVRRAACEDVVRWCGCVCGCETEYRVCSSSKFLQQP